MTKIQTLYNSLCEARQAYSFVCGSDVEGRAQALMHVAFTEKEIYEFIFGPEVKTDE
tara:strand:+ start:32 stop:202 length:171 start_codon:yes stop_codon:yes gene_type:complete